MILLEKDCFDAKYVFKRQLGLDAIIVEIHYKNGGYSKSIYYKNIQNIYYGNKDYITTTLNKLFNLQDFW